MLKPYSRADVEFDLRTEIGVEGKNSRVFIAHDPQLDAQLVIKQIDKNKLDVDLYFRESSLLYGSTHSNVVPIHYACQDADNVYLAMPHYARGSLKKLMTQRFLTVREIVVFSTQFLSGLHHIHSKHLVHFDIKPDNILISDRGEALLADFGLAMVRGLNGLAEPDGLYSKMTPPEAVRVSQFDHRFDIYQVGLTIYRMCVGDKEFYNQYQSHFVNGELDRMLFRHAILNGQFPNTASDHFPEHIPDKLINVIRRCLRTEPDERYSSAIEVVNDLASIDGELLDWQYFVDPDARGWTKTQDGAEARLVMDDQRRSIATKRASGGNERRIATYCSDGLNRQATKRFLREH